MKRVALLAGILFIHICSLLHAFPTNEIGAVLGLRGGKMEYQVGYSLQKSDSFRLNVSAHLDDDFSGSFRAENTENGFGVYGGSGNPANTIALRYKSQVAEIVGRPFPWAVSSSSNGMIGMGLRFDLLDFLILMDGSLQVDDTSNQILKKLSAAAIQASSKGDKFSGGLAFSIANPKRESYGEGWGQEPIPFAGGILSTFSIAGQVSFEDFMIEAWSSLSAGILESPGVAILLRCIWEIYRNPCIQVHLFSFLSSDRYRNWLGDSPECDVVISGIIQVDWDKITLRLDGNIMSLNDAETSWQLTEGSLGLRFVIRTMSMQGEIQFDHEGLDTVSGKLGYRLNLGLLTLSHLDLSLAARKSASATYAAGLSLGWNISPDTHSKGEAGFQFSLEDGSEAYVFSISGSFSQKFSFHRWGFASVGMKSPEGGYQFGMGSLELPEVSVSMTLKLPPY